MTPFRPTWDDIALLYELRNSSTKYPELADPALALMERMAEGLERDESHRAVQYLDHARRTKARNEERLATIKGWTPPRG